MTLRQALVAHECFTGGRESVRLVYNGLIFVNGQQAESPDMDIVAGDSVTFFQRGLHTHLFTQE